jgi:hypothetical protein
MTQPQQESLVNMIYKSAGAENTGEIDRVQLKEAMIKNEVMMNAYTEEEIPNPLTNAVVAKVMDNLNSTNSGTIRKRDLKKALLTFNDDNHTELDVDLIVREIFEEKPTLERSVIRSKMNQNPVIQETVAAEPIQDQIMRQLESIPSSTISIRDLNKAVA